MSGISEYEMRQFATELGYDLRIDIEPTTLTTLIQVHDLLTKGMSPYYGFVTTIRGKSPFWAMVEAMRVITQ